MKKHFLSVALISAVAASTLCTSCIGSFALTNKLLSWNKQVSNKFVNELVFFAFWVIPVYEVAALADVVVINSIEFWSGSNPLTASTKVVDTDNGRYLIACDGKGYTVTNEQTGEAVRLNFEEYDRTWSVETADGEQLPFMTFIDDSHVKMLTPDGDFMPVELSESGVMAYEAAAGMLPMAAR